MQIQKEHYLFSMEKIFSSEALIRFSDCDPIGHLNNQRYMDYFLNAREDHLRQYLAFDIYNYAQKEGKVWVMFQNQITYLKPVYYNHIVILTSRLFNMNEKSVHVEMQMIDKKSGNLNALVWMIAVHIDLRTNKSIPHPAEIQLMMEENLSPIDQKDYQSRVKFFQNSGNQESLK